MGGALLALGAWWTFRGRLPGPRAAFLAVGGLLALLGAAAPGRLRVPRRAWMALAEILGAIATTAVLFLVFFLVVTPLGVLRRALGKDPLRTPAAGWRPYAARRRDARHYEKLY